jgi:hypothetical protein
VLIVEESKLVDLSYTETPKAQARSLDDPASLGSDRRSSLWWLLLVGVATALLSAPFFRVLFFLGDEGVMLRGAEIILQGKRLYADIFEFLPPGGFLLTAAWFSIAGISFGSARALAVLTFVGIACFTYLTCRQASRNAPLSALLVTGFVMLTAWPWMQVSYHWFATLFSMMAAWATFASLEQPKRRLRWPLIAGAAAGAAAMATPHAGALAALAAMTAFLNLRQNRAELIVYLLGCALAPAGTLAYLLEQHTLVTAFYDVLLTAAGYTSYSTAPWGSFAANYDRPLVYIFGLAALLTLFVCAYDWRAALRDPRLRLCGAFALAGFVLCFPRPDVVHISFSVPLALPLLAFCMTRLTESWRPVYRYAAAAAVIALCAPSAYQFAGFARQAVRSETVQTPRGDVALVGQFTAHRGIPELLASIAATPPGDAYFFYPYDAMLQFLTAREHVSKYDLFTPGTTPPARYRDACLSAMRRASWVVVDRKWTDYDTWRASYPAMHDSEPPQETKQFQQTLDNAFDLVAKDGSFEMRRRREGVSDVVCDAITK